MNKKQKRASVVSALIMSLMIFSTVKVEAKVIELSLKAAMDMGLTTSEDYKIKKNDEIKMQYQYDEVKGSIYPDVNADVKWENYQKKPTTTMDLSALHGPVITTELKKDYEMTAGVTATQVLWAFGKVTTAIELAKKAFSMSHLDVDVQKDEVLYNVKMAYYSVILAERAVDVARSSYENAKNNLSILKERFSFGRPPQGDSIKMEADIADRLPRLKNAEAQLTLARQTLKYLIGANDDDEIKLTTIYSEEFAVVEEKSLTETLLQEQPVLKLLDENIKLKGDLIKIRKADFLPTLGGFVSWNYIGGSTDDFYVGKDNMQQVGVVGLSLKVPIWDGGARLGRYRQAVMDKTNSILSYEKTKRSFDLGLKNAIAEHDALLETYKANKQAYEMAKKLFNMSQNLFRAGKTTISSLNDAELMLTGQRLQKDLTQYKINSSIALIEKLTSKDE